MAEKHATRRDGAIVADLQDVLVHDFYNARDPATHIFERTIICENCHSELTFPVHESDLEDSRDIISFDPDAITVGDFTFYQKWRILRRNNPNVGDVLAFVNTEHVPMNVVENERLNRDMDEFMIID